MTTKLKKLLTSLLAFSLVLGMLPMGTMASAAASITNEGITVREYHVPYSNVPALEAYARASTTTDMGNRHITQIYVHFTDGSKIPLVKIVGTWSGTISSVSGHQPSNVDSIQLGFWRAFHQTVFVTIGADQLNFANYEGTMNFTEISLASENPTPPVEYHSLSVSYVFPDNEKPDGEFIDYVDQLKAGDAFTVEEIDAPGYTRTVTVDGAKTEVIDGALSGTMPEGDVTVTFTYTPVVEPATEYLTFQYVKPDKANVSDAPPDIIPPSQIEVTPNGYMYSYAKVGSHAGEALIPDGYVFDGWFRDEDCTTKVLGRTFVSYAATFYGYWTKTPDPIVPAETYAFSVSYVFTDGKKPEGAFIDYAEQLEAAVTYTAVAIDAPDGYTRTVTVDGQAAEVPVSGKMPAKPVSVTFTYTPTLEPPAPTTYAFSVSYVFTDGTHHEGFGTRTKQLEVDADYSAEVLAAPEGYHQLDRFDITGATLLTGKMPANDVSVTFHYAIDEPIVTPPVEPPVTPPVEPPVTPPSPSYSYYRATVRYLALDTNAVLADAYSTDTIREGRSYDVSAQAALAISGYTIDHVEGATSGTLNGNVTVTVWYSAETVLENPDVPLVDVPEVPPTTPPAPDASGETDEVILVDPETPLGDLPQTGIVAEAADPANTLGFAALAASMAMAGLAVTLNRKREDAE